MLKAENILLIKSKKTILENINFTISPGESVGIVGPNGSGKSSLLKILASLDQPTSGQVWYKGTPLPKRVPLTVRRRMAMVFQEALLLNTSVYENVAVGLKMRFLPKAEINKRVYFWLEQFGIPHLAKQAASSLSGGEAQRVSLARAFALEPEVLFLDEPFSALDAPTKDALRKDLATIFQQTKVTTLLVSHDFADIQSLTQRALVLLDGKIAAEATPAELLRKPQPPQVEQFLAHWR